MTTLHQVTDIDMLMTWRAEVIENVFGAPASPALLAANRSYYARNIAGGTHYAYVARVDDREAGCGAICLTEELPSPDNPSGRCAYLMNIYVRRPFRNHGVAHFIVTNLIEKAKALDCGKIYLETTEQGRPVYESLGFSDMPDMMKLSEK